MLQFSSISSQFHILINKVSRCIQEKDLVELKNCVNEIEEKYGSLQNFGDLINVDVEHIGEDRFVDELLEDVMCYGNLDIFNYLAIEKNIPINKKSLIYSAITGEQFEFLKCFLMKDDTDDVNLNDLVHAYVTYIVVSRQLGIKDKELENAFFSAIQKKTNESTFEIIMENVKDENTISRMKIKIEGMYKSIAQGLDTLNGLANHLAEKVNDSSEPLIKEAMEQILNSLCLFCEQYAKNGSVVQLLRINLNLVVINFQKYINSDESLKNKISPETIDIIYRIFKILNGRFVKREEENKKLEIINKILSEQFYLLSDSILRNDAKALSDAFSKLEEKGLSIEKLDEMRASVVQRPNGALIMQILGDAVTNHEIYDYLTKEKKIQCLDALSLQGVFLKAVSFNQIETVIELLESNQIMLSFAIKSYSSALRHNDNIIANRIFEMIKKVSPIDAQNLNRLREELKQNAIRRHSEILLNAELMMYENLKIVKKCIEYFTEDEVNDSSMPDILDCAQKLDLMLQVIIKSLKENEITAQIPLAISELLAIKINLLVERHEKLQKNAELKKFTQLLVARLHPEFLHQITSKVDINKLPEALRTQMYRDMGESAIDKSTSNEYGLYHQIKRQYQEKYDEICSVDSEKDDGEVNREKEAEANINSHEGKGPINLASFPCYPILQDLEDYLITEFKKAGLDKEFNSNWSQEELELYYKNKFHTAWRYLFCRPNPWLSLTAESNIKWTKHGASDINDDDIELIAYFWLAASDENAKCTNSFTRKLRQEHFVDQLAWFGREYNNGNKRDDLEGDKPTCNIGVKKRGYQLLIGHPILDEIKELKPETFMQYFHETFIAENDSHQTLFKRLNELAENTDTQQILIQLKDALESWIMDCGKVDEFKQDLLTSYFSIDIDNELKEVSIQFCKSVIDVFGLERINNTKISYQAETFESYAHFLLEIAHNPVKYFIQALYKKASSLVESIEKKSKEHHDEKAGPSIVTSFENHRKQKQPSRQIPYESEDTSKRKGKEKICEDEIVKEDNKAKKKGVSGRR